ncbi:MAG: peptidoglycan-associated lipoprotein Pal [bacterium]|nr:peptidoglycan-associated lipoprotein Pal [bacterium]
MKYSTLGLAVVVLAGGMLIATTGCGPKPKPEMKPSINLDSLRAAEEAKRRADSIAAAEEARRLAEDAARKREMEEAKMKAEAEAKDKALIKVIYFDYDKSNIRNDMSTDCQSNAALYKKYPNWRVALEGHADERGTNEYNLALGDRRAQSVKKYLTDFGIDAGRISTISFGEERPVAKGTGEQSWSKNRRVEFNTK